MEYKPTVFNELNRLRDEELLQMSKNDTLIRLIAERQSKGKIFGSEFGSVTISDHNVWSDYIDLPSINMGVGRLIQVRLFIPFTYCDPSNNVFDGNSTSLSHIMAWNTTLNRAVAWHSRQYNPSVSNISFSTGHAEYVPSSGDGVEVVVLSNDIWRDGGLGGGILPGGHRGDMRQSVFMTGVFPTYDMPTHHIVIRANPINGTLFLSDGAYLTLEDMGAMV